MKHKVAFIGPDFIHEALQEFDDSWDLQVPLATVKQFDDLINSEDDNPLVSRDTKLIIVFSRLFHQDPDLFADVVAYYAPYAVVAILIPTPDMAQDKDRIANKIKAAQVALHGEYEDYNSNTPFYFARYEQAQEDIQEAIIKFTQDPAVEEETVENIKTMLPSQSLANAQPEIEEVSSSNHVKIAEAKGNGQVITITSSKGGSGKSTVAISLASFIAKASEDAANKGKIGKKYKVIVIDLDVRDGQLSFLNGDSKAPNIVDIVMAGPLSEQTIRDGIYHNTRSGVDYIFASKRPRNASEIPPSLYADMIQILRGMYDYIFLDTSVNYLDPLLEEVAYPIADKVIFVTDMGISSIFGMRRWITENVSTEDFKKVIDSDRVGIVINKAIKDVNMGPDKIQMSAKGLPILGVIPSAPQLITYSANINELQRILNFPAINSAFRGFAEAVVDDENALGEVSFNS